LAAAFALLALLACPAGRGWAAQGGDGCAAAKLVAASQRAASKVGCYAAALKKGVAVAAVCLAQADEKFAVAFAKVETKGGCAVPGDADSIGSAVDDCVATLVADEPIAP
jgi:hypothetical protein